MIIFKVKDIEDAINFIKNEENIKNCIIYNYSRTRKFQIKFVENTKVLIQALSYKIIIEMELSDIEKMLEKNSFRLKYNLENKAGVFKDLMVYIYQDQIKFLDESETRYYYTTEFERNHSGLSIYFRIPEYYEKRYRNAYAYINHKYNKRTQVSIAKDIGVANETLRSVVLAKKYREEYCFSKTNRFNFISYFPYCREFMRRYNIPTLNNLKRVGREYLEKFRTHYINELELEEDTAIVYKYYIEELIEFAIEFDGDNTFESINKFFAGLYVPKSQKED